MCSNRGGDWRFCVASLVRNFPKEMSTVHANDPEAMWGPLPNVMYTSTLAEAGVRMGPSHPGLITLLEMGMGLEHLIIFP